MLRSAIECSNYAITPFIKDNEEPSNTALNDTSYHHRTSYSINIMPPPCTCDVATMTDLGFISKGCSARFPWFAAAGAADLRCRRLWWVLAVFVLVCQVRELRGKGSARGNPWEGINVGCNIKTKEMHVEEKSCRTSERKYFA